MGYVLPDTTAISWLVETGRRSASSADTWDNANWNEGFWDGGSVVDFTVVPESLILSMQTKQGKDQFGKRYKAGVLTMMMDNQDGLFTQIDTGLQPGDYVSVKSSVLFPPGPPDVPIPDDWTWNDETGRQWTAHGSLVLADDTPDVPVEANIFYGRVYSATDTVKGGRDVTKVIVYDFFMDLAMATKDAVPAVGAGETSFNRALRIVNNAGLSGTLGGSGTYEATMLATTLAGKALDQLHITVESEGGDLFASNASNGSNDLGVVIFKPRDWLTTDPRSTNVQYVLGGQVGLLLTDAKVSRQVDIVVNNATISNEGGVSQNTQDAPSIQRYGERTFRRLDLQADQDTQAQFLSNRIVSNLKNVRPRIREVTTPVVDAETAAYASRINMGDLILTTVNSVNGWAYTALGHVIGISQQIFEKEWILVLKLDDAFVANVDGAFNVEMFSNAFTLGEQP